MEIAFLGIGLMGRPMAGRLMDAGHRLFLFNRTRSRIEDLSGPDSIVTDSAVEAIRQVACVILMLKDAAAVEDVLFGGDPLSLGGRTVIQMGTILPAESRSLDERVRQAGGEYFECPVLGSRDKAAVGELILMAGCTPQQFGQFEPLLRVFGRSLRRVGEVGQAAALKLALNHLIAAELAAFSLSLAMVCQAGVSPDDFMGILRESALYAPAFDKKLARLMADDFSDPNFPVRHMLKDMRLVLAEAASGGLDTRLLRALEGILEQAVAQGLGELDYSAMARVIQGGNRGGNRPQKAG